MNDLIRVILSLTVWVSFFAAYAFRLGSSLRRPRLGDVAVRDARKDAEREEQYRIQQDENYESDFDKEIKRLKDKT